METWNALEVEANDGFTQFAGAVQEAAAAARFGSGVLCEGMERSDQPEDEDWTAVVLKISSEESIQLLMSAGIRGIVRRGAGNRRAGSEQHVAGAKPIF